MSLLMGLFGERRRAESCGSVPREETTEVDEKCRLLLVQGCRRLGASRSRSAHESLLWLPEERRGVDSSGFEVRKDHVSWVL